MDSSQYSSSTSSSSSSSASASSASPTSSSKRNSTTTADETPKKKWKEAKSIVTRKLLQSLTLLKLLKYRTFDVKKYVLEKNSEFPTDRTPKEYKRNINGKFSDWRKILEEKILNWPSATKLCWWRIRRRLVVELFKRLGRKQALDSWGQVFSRQGLSGRFWTRF